VRPDGGLSFPLVGDVAASGKTVTALREEFTERLKRYVPSPVVTVAVKQINGNHIYVVGKVQRPGEFPFGRPLDVMQALSLAGGATPFASVNDIVILHRENGQQRAIRFHYSDVARGKNLAQNIQLQSGDIVVVP
jgi:polysaccharide export outer membrane protein